MGEQEKLDTDYPPGIIFRTKRGRTAQAQGRLDLDDGPKIEFVQPTKSGRNKPLGLEERTRMKQLLGIKPTAQESRRLELAERIRKAKEREGRKNLK